MIPMRAGERVERSSQGAAAGRGVEPVDGLRDLAGALLSLRDAEEVTRFLRDLCTLPELEALAHRWQIVQLLDEGAPYVEIAERVPSSTATVTRVAQWLRHGTGGYQLALERRGARRP
jgi:TrpR-related protein YerC/YecD